MVLTITEQHGFTRTVLTPVTTSCVASAIPCPLKAVHMPLLWNHGKFLDSVMKMTGNKMEPFAPSYNW